MIENPPNFQFAGPAQEAFYNTPICHGGNSFGATLLSHTCPLCLRTPQQDCTLWQDAQEEHYE